MRRFHTVALAAVALALSGCLSDAKDPDSPGLVPSTGVPQLPQASATFRAQFDPTKAQMPYPNDVLGFLAQGSTDGTLNLPVQPFQLAATAVNELDGFSVFSRIQANFTRPVAPASLNPATVFLLEVAMSPSTKAVMGLSDTTLCKVALAPAEACAAIGVSPTGNPFLVQGVDYTVSVAPDVDAGGQTIQLVPLKPLNSNRPNQFTPGTENGYLLILTNGITDTSGTPAQADTTYAQIRGAFLAGMIPLPPPPEVDPFAAYMATHLAVAQNLQLPVANIVVSASFTTQHTTAVLEAVAGLEILENRPSQIAQALLPFDLPLPGGGALPAGTPVTTGLVRTLIGFPPEATLNNGNAYVGGINIPYFQQPPSEAAGGYNVLTSKWVAEAGANILGDPNSTIVSRWNPVPVKRADITVPLLIVLPNENSATWQGRAALGLPNPPEEGWPVAIYQHGATRSRVDIFLTAEPLLDNGFAVIAMDLPFHGVTATNPAQDPTALFRVPGTTERTFDLDLRNNANPADLTPDGIIDDNFVNFVNVAPPAGMLTSRDNLREAVVGILALRRSIAGMDLDGDPATTDLDASRVALVGHSTGGMAGIGALAVSDEFSAVVTPNAAAGWTEVLTDGQSFAPVYQGLRAGLQANGIMPDSSAFNNYLRDFQHLVNEGEPIGYGRAAARSPVPVLLMMTNGDATLPNPTTLRLAELMGLPQVTTLGPNLASRGWTRFTAGGHSSFLDPSVSPAASIEMWRQSSVFVGGFAPAGLPGDGQVILISDPTVVEVAGP